MKINVFSMHFPMKINVDGHGSGCHDPGWAFSLIGEKGFEEDLAPGAMSPGTLFRRFLNAFFSNGFFNAFFPAGPKPWTLLSARSRPARALRPPARGQRSGPIPHSIHIEFALLNGWRHSQSTTRRGPFACHSIFACPQTPSLTLLVLTTGEFS